MLPTAMTLLHSMVSASLGLEVRAVLMHPPSDVTQALLLGRSSIFRDYESRRTHSVGRRLCGHGKHKMRDGLSDL